MVYLDIRYISLFILLFLINKSVPNTSRVYSYCYMFSYVLIKSIKDGNILRLSIIWPVMQWIVNMVENRFKFQKINHTFDW